MTRQRGISPRHLHGSHTVGKSPQSRRRIVIIRHDSGKFHPADVGKSPLRRQLAEQPPGAAVHRLPHRLLHGHPVSRQADCLQPHFLRLCHVDIGQQRFCRIVFLQRRSIDRQRLKGTARLPPGLIRPVQCIDSRFLAPAPHDGDHLMRLIVNNRRSTLERIDSLRTDFLIKCHHLIDGILQKRLLPGIQ